MIQLSQKRIHDSKNSFIQFFYTFKPLYFVLLHKAIVFCLPMSNIFIFSPVVLFHLTSASMSLLSCSGSLCIESAEPNSLLNMDFGSTLFVKMCFMELCLILSKTENFRVNCKEIGIWLISIPLRHYVYK